MKYKFVVIYTDFGDTCDGLARVCGTFDTSTEARENMLDDVKRYITQLKKNSMFPEHYEINEQTDNHILVGDVENGCQWQILSVEV